MRWRCWWLDLFSPTRNCTVGTTCPFGDHCRRRGLTLPKEFALERISAHARAADQNSRLQPGHRRSVGHRYRRQGSDDPLPRPRVQIYAAGMGEVFGLAETKSARPPRAERSCNDIGKRRSRPTFSTKPGKLSPARIRKDEIHPTVGAPILSRVDFPYPVIPIVRPSS